jgi:polysaccharide biosynthesis transport protein
MSSSNLPAYDESGAGTDALDFRKVASILWAKAWVIIVCLILAGGATFLYLYRAVPLYAAQAVLEYQPGRGEVFDITGIQTDMTSGSTELRLRQFQRQLGSRDLHLRMVEKGGLTKDPRFPMTPVSGELSAEDAARMLGRMVSVTVPRNDNLLIVTVEHPRPEMAAELVNLLVEEAIEDMDEKRAESLELAGEQLQQSMRKLQEDWRAREEQLLPHRRKATELDNRLRMVMAEMEQVNAGRIALSLEAYRLDAVAKEAKQQGTNVQGLLKLATIASNPDVQSLRQSLMVRELDFNGIKQRYKHKHPAYIQAESELEGLQMKLAHAVLNAALAIEQQIEAVHNQQEGLMTSYNELNQQAELLSNAMAADSDDIMVRELDLQRSIHDRVMQRLKEAAVTGDLLHNPLLIADRAGVPMYPSKPQKVRVIALGILAGLVAGVGLALALGFVDTSLKTLEETEQFLNFPVLSAVPRISDLESARSQIIMNDEANFAGGEAFRSLRTSISVLNKDKTIKTLLFTSALPEEGKTFCALNYAVSLAQQGLRTLLVECDLRRPMVAQALPDIRDDAAGVTDYLRCVPAVAPSTRPAEPVRRTGSGLSFAELRRKQEGQGTVVGGGSVAADLLTPGVGGGDRSATRVALDEFVQKTGVENLFFLSAGTPSPDSSELLGQAGAISSLLNDAYRRYDRVVIDSAPLLGVSDTLLLAMQVHAVCLVIRGHRTPRKSIQRALEMLQRAEAPVMGVVLNGLVANRSDYYSDYYHYGYGAKAPEKKAKAKEA